MTLDPTHLLLRDVANFLTPVHLCRNDPQLWSTSPKTAFQSSVNMSYLWFDDRI